MEDIDVYLDFVVNPEGQSVGVFLDIVDFTYICHAGRNKDTAFFSRMLQTVEEMNDEKNDI